MRITIRILTLAAGILAASSSAVMAQGDDGGDKARPDRPGPRRGPPPRLLEKFDKNNDGKLDEEERKAVREAMKKRKAEALAKYDEDNDGKLNAEERRKMFDDRLLERFDENDNGVLDGEEVEKAEKAKKRLRRALERRRHHRGPHGKGPRGPRPGPEPAEETPDP